MTALAGARVLLTGAGGGIGRALAGALAAKGARMALSDLDAGRLAETARSLPGAHFSREADLSDKAALAALAQDAVKSLGGIDILINNAGVGYNGIPVWEIAAPDWDWVFSINFFAAASLIRATLPGMLSRGRGHIVNMSSISGLMIPPKVRHGLYGASKHALTGLTEGLRDDLEGTGIHVTLVCPSGVRSGLARSGLNRPAAYGGPFERAPSEALAAMLERAMPAEEFARQVTDAIERDIDVLVTGPEEWPDLARWHGRIKGAFDRIGGSA